MPDATAGAFTTLDQNVSDVLLSDIAVIASTDPDRPQENAKAVWDTGAMCSVISKDLATKLKLKPFSIKLIGTPSGTMNAEMYVVDLMLPNKIEVKQVRVLGAYPSGSDFLIGMDVIGLGDFAVTNYLNQTAFSFRIPSKERIDFTIL